MRGVLAGVLGAAGMAALAWAGSVEAGESMVVVHAKGAPVAPGTLVDGSQPFTLSTGAELTLIRENGEPLVLTGPYAGTPEALTSAGSFNVADALAGFLSRNAESTASLGAVRAAGVGPDPAPEPWLVSVHEAGTACVKEGDPIVLWRQSASETQELMLSDGEGIRRGRTEWRAEQDRMQVPDSFEIEDGGALVAGLDGARNRIDIRMVPAALDTPGEQAAFMARAGCAKQALAMLGTLN